MRRFLFFLILLLLPLHWSLSQQGRITTTIDKGAGEIKIAIPILQPTTAGDKSTQLSQIFNQVLWDDLEYAGSITLISRSFYPLGRFASPGDIKVDDWKTPQIGADLIVFGSTSVNNGKFSTEVRLWDLKVQQNQEMLGNRYGQDDNENAVRELAHRVADDILEKIGLPKGVARTKITFVSDRGDGINKELYVMDYDGSNAYPLTTLKSITLTPTFSPDGQKIAFTTYRGSSVEIGVISTIDHHRFPFPTLAGLNTTPAWSPDGSRIAFATSKDNNDGTEIYVADWDGSHMRRLTVSRGADVSPAWNPKTGREIVFVSDRSGTPQIWRMDAEGTNLHRVIDDGGDAENPSWSPDGQTIAFAWQKRGARFDIYLHDLASGKNVQLTHDQADNERPTWSPDGKHIAFESNRSGTTQIYSMLADGTKLRQLTKSGKHNQGPNWSSYVQ